MKNDGRYKVYAISEYHLLDLIQYLGSATDWQIRQMHGSFGMPADAIVEAVTADWHSKLVCFRVWSSEFPVNPEGAEFPRVCINATWRDVGMLDVWMDQRTRDEAKAFRDGAELPLPMKPMHYYSSMRRCTDLATGQMITLTDSSPVEDDGAQQPVIIPKELQ